MSDVVQWTSPYVVAAATWYAKIWYDEGKSIVEARTRKMIARISKKALPPNPALQVSKDNERLADQPIEGQSARYGHT